MLLLGIFNQKLISASGSKFFSLYNAKRKYTKLEFSWNQKIEYFNLKYNIVKMHLYALISFWLKIPRKSILQNFLKITAEFPAINCINGKLKPKTLSFLVKVMVTFTVTVMVTVTFMVTVTARNVYEITVTVTYEKRKINCIILRKF